jgi:hypothetical protein
MSSRASCGIDATLKNAAPKRWLSRQRSTPTAAHKSEPTTARAIADGDFHRNL